MAAREIPGGRLRALHGGGLVRVCPECGVEIEDDTAEVVADYAVPGDLAARVAKNPDVKARDVLIPSYHTEIADRNWRAHWRKEHA